MRSLEIVDAHNKYRIKTLNLQASENYLSHNVRWALASDMASRYSMVFDATVHGEFVHNAYGGTRFQEKITNLASELASEIFKFSYANPKPISGHVAAMAVLLALSGKGDKIMAIPPELGGYDGYSQGYLPDMFGLKFIPLHIQNGRFVDTDSIMDSKPKLIILGASYITFPYNLKEVIEVAQDIKAHVVYDASHVLGLIPGGFQEWIEECDVVYGSTHKSYPGPQGGIILTNHREIHEAIERNLTWRVQDNYHTNRVAALAVSLEEFKPVSLIYWSRVKENSKTLATKLHSLGIEIMYPHDFTESHQILVDISSLKSKFGISAVQFGEMLEENGIIVDRVGRIGTAELTWKGYVPQDMEKIGEMIYRAIQGDDVSHLVQDMAEKWDGKTLGNL